MANQNQEEQETQESDDFLQEPGRTGGQAEEERYEKREEERQNALHKP